MYGRYFLITLFSTVILILLSIIAFVLLTDPNMFNAYENYNNTNYKNDDDLSNFKKLQQARLFLNNSMVCIFKWCLLFHV